MIKERHIDNIYTAKTYLRSSRFSKISKTQLLYIDKSTTHNNLVQVCMIKLFPLFLLFSSFYFFCSFLFPNSREFFIKIKYSSIIIMLTIIIMSFTVETIIYKERLTQARSHTHKMTPLYSYMVMFIMQLS